MSFDKLLLSPLSLPPSFSPLIDDFKKLFLSVDPSRVIFPLTWTLSDTVLLDLLSRYTKVTPHVVLLDCLYFFPETLAVGNEVAQKYQIQPEVFKPRNCDTREDFGKLHGQPDLLAFHDYDEFARKEPLRRAVRKYSNYIFLFSRRNDENPPRKLVQSDLEKRVLNPLANWKWKEIATYALEADLPLHPFYYQLLRSEKPLSIDQRVGYSQWERQILDVPYFTLSDWGTNGSQEVYRWEYIGDIFSSTPVGPSDLNYSGKFGGKGSLRQIPHGGHLKDLIAPENQLLLPLATKRLILTERQKCDVELLLNGGFSPLEGFLTQTSFLHVVRSHRLPDGLLWGIPTTLDTDMDDIQTGDYVRLYDQGRPVAILRVDSKWIPDRLEEAKEVYGTTSPEHSAVFHLMHERNKYYVGGPLYGLELPKRDWVTCHPPRALAHRYTTDSLVAFQCRNPIHRAHAMMFSHVTSMLNAHVIVHPIVGPTKMDDFSAPVRKLTYEALRKIIPKVDFEYLPYNMMVGGPRECLQHLLIRKNYSFTHMIVGRDHAGCKNHKGEEFYGPYDSQNFVTNLEEELGIKILPFQHMVYIPDQETYAPAEEAESNGWSTKNISGSEFRRRIVNGEEIPEWFAFPAVVEILRQHYGPAAPKFPLE